VNDPLIDPPCPTMGKNMALALETQGLLILERYARDRAYLGMVFSVLPILGHHAPYLGITQKNERALYYE